MKYVLVCTEYILEGKIIKSSTYLRQNVCTWYIFFLGTYQYIPVHTSTWSFSLIWCHISLISKGYVCVHTDFVWVHTFISCFFCAPPWPSRLLLPVIAVCLLAMRSGLLCCHYTFTARSLHVRRSWLLEMIAAASSNRRALLRAEVWTWTGALARLIGTVVPEVSLVVARLGSDGQ